MNFAKPTVSTRRPRLMQINDLIILYERHDALDHIYLKPGKIHQNKFGAFYHSDIIGKPFGSKIKSRTTTGYIYVLEPTPELWSTAVYTRTQIVNELDSSVVTLMLDVYPGCTVVESGTGSGCMTLSLARAVAPNGKVFTFEYNNVRAAKAAEEFAKLKVDNLVTVQCKDVCGKYDTQGEGGFTGVEDQGADAVFLDLPEPWLALEHAKKVLKAGRNICCYSPCIEQVMKVCEKLRELSFHSIRMLEVRQRPYDARIIDVETLHLGLSAEEEDVMNCSAADPDHRNMRPLPKPSTSTENIPRKKARLHNANKVETEDTQVLQVEEDREKGELDDEMEASLDNEVKGTIEKEEPRDISRRVLNRPKPAINGSYTSFVARPIGTMKGHTAFLTFATRPIEAATIGSSSKQKTTDVEK